MGTFRTSLSGDLDLDREDELDAVVGSFRRSSDRNAEVDLAHVSFMDSTGLTLLLRLRDVAQERGGAVTLVDPPGLCVTMLEATHLCGAFLVAARDGAEPQLSPS